MKKASTETQYLTHEQPQNPAVRLACIGFFPMLYFIGKAVVTFIG